MRPHRSEAELAELKEQAAALRAAGVGAKRIAQRLGISHDLARKLLRDVPVPSSLMRMRAKDELREAALALRRDGRTYDEIRTELGVSKGSLSLWLRDLARPTEEQREAVRARAAEEPPMGAPPDAETARALRHDGWLLREIAERLGVSVPVVHRWCVGLPVPARASHGRPPEELRASVRASWNAKNAVRDAERAVIVAGIAESVGELTLRELELVCAANYWCEGTKGSLGGGARRSA